MNSAAQKIVRFGVFELDRISGELRKQGLKIRLSDQPLQILLLLIERAGETVTRDEVRRRLWPADTFVDFDAGLNSAVKKLRDALGDPAENPRFIETVPRRGYRFIGPLEQPAIQPLHPDGVPPMPARADLGEVPPIPARVSASRPHRRWVLTATLTASLLIVIVAWLSLGDAWGSLWDRIRVGASPRRITSIAVLPFENLSGSKEQDYFVDGMTEALTNNLAQFKSLKVVSRTSAAQYKQRPKSLVQIARELDVDAVIDGGVARSGDRMHLTVQLIDAATDSHIWAKDYELEVRDVLRLQIELAEMIATTIHIEVRPEERRRLTQSQTNSLEAYDEYLKGRFYWSSRGDVNLLRAEEHFLNAIQRDSTYAPAWSGLSDTYRLFDMSGLAAPRDCMPKAEAAAREALKYDDTLAEAHASLAGVLYRYHWKWTEAEQEFRHALELDPDYAEGHRAMAVFLLMLRRNQEAVSAVERARELSPLSPNIKLDLAHALMRMGRYEEALEQVRKAQEIAPEHPRVPAAFAMVYLQMGDPARALATLDGVPATARRGPWFGYIYGIQGRRQEARNVLTELDRRARSEHVSPQHLAVVHLGLGEEEQALSLLERAYEERAFEVFGFSGPLADILLDKARFQAIVHRMGLGDQPGYAPRKR
jgi:TolB-like protein/DNA-binding winged helix-turn-helix (wHTH) protein/lipoprotein NlpI